MEARTGVTGPDGEKEKKVGGEGVVMDTPAEFKFRKTYILTKEKNEKTTYRKSTPH